MKSSNFCILGLVALPVAAQEPSFPAAISGFPGCALSCLGADNGTTTCAVTDLACMCADQTLQGIMTKCVLANCTVREALLTKNLTATACHEPVRDKSASYVAISNTCGIISALFVIQRFAYKYWAKIDFGPDDWFTLASIVVGVPSTVFNAYPVVQNGMGRDVWTLTPNQIADFGMFFYMLEINYLAEIALVKIALLCFYVRIFPSTAVRRLLWGTVAFVCLFGIIFVFVALFQCTPVNHFWLQWDREHPGMCLDINAIAWSNAAISIALDGWMLGIPLWQLRALHMDWRKKAGVAIMFCVGTSVTIVSILRLRSLVKFGSETMNLTWDFFDVGVWSTVEINVGIICVCMPTLRLLLVRLFPRLLGTTQRTYEKYSSGRHLSMTVQRPTQLGRTGTISRAERSHDASHTKGNQITCQTTYTVEFDDLTSSTVRELECARSDGSASPLSHSHLGLGFSRMDG
ncbi:hypothetical protein RJ55_04274 [Drechmeria coniospora]|nr:hypothetical protein RJ55_04274 [Drechmeria coniospora]